MNTAQAVARYLRELGVRRAFGVPGGELVELIEALRRQDIPFILTHHEAPAAFMAAMTGELSGAPGVCRATRGPGAVNLFAGVATAFVDRRPLIAFTGDHTPDAARRDTHQNLPLVDLFRPVTRLSELLTAEPELGEVRRCCSTAPSSGPTRTRLGLARFGPTSMRKPLSRPERDEHGTSQTSIRHQPPRRRAMRDDAVAPFTPATSHCAMSDPGVQPESRPRS
jgi:acetolactate synthase-1/2/3 large subunit